MQLAAKTDLPQAAISAALLRRPFRQPPAPEQHQLPEGDATGAVDDRYPLRTRLRVILGASLLLWGLILWAAGLL